MFPDRPLVDVPLSHPIYHIVYDFPKGIPKIHEHDGLAARGFGIFSRRIPVPPDPATLRSIANRTGGEFFQADSAKSVQAAYSKLGSSLGRTPGKTEITFGFLLGGIVLLLGAGLASILFAPRFP